MKKFILLWLIILVGVVSANLECSDNGVWSDSLDYSNPYEPLLKTNIINGLDYNNCNLVVTDVTSIKGSSLSVIADDEGYSLTVEKDVDGKLNGYNVELKEGMEISFEDGMANIVTNGKELVFTDVMTVKGDGTVKFNMTNGKLNVLIEDNLKYEVVDRDYIIFNNYLLSFDNPSIVSLDENNLVLNLNAQEVCSTNNAKLTTANILYDDFRYTISQNRCNTEIKLDNKNFIVKSSVNTNNIELSYPTETFSKDSVYKGKELKKTFVMNNEDTLEIVNTESKISGIYKINSDDELLNNGVLNICENKINKGTAVLGSGSEVDFIFGDNCVITSCQFSKNKKTNGAYDLTCGSDYPNFVVNDAKNLNDLYVENNEWTCDSGDCFGVMGGDLGFETGWYFGSSDNQFVVIKLKDGVSIDTIGNFKSLKVTGTDYDIKADTFTLGKTRFTPHEKNGAILKNTDNGYIVSVKGKQVYNKIDEKRYILQENSDDEDYGGDMKYDFYVDMDKLSKIDCCLSGTASGEKTGVLGEVEYYGCDLKSSRNDKRFYMYDNGAYKLASSDNCNVVTSAATSVSSSTGVVTVAPTPTAIVSSVQCSDTHSGWSCQCGMRNLLDPKGGTILDMWTASECNNYPKSVDGKSGCETKLCMDPINDDYNFYCCSDDAANSKSDAKKGSTKVTQMLTAIPAVSTRSTGSRGSSRTTTRNNYVSLGDYCMTDGAYACLSKNDFAVCNWADDILSWKESVYTCGSGYVCDASLCNANSAELDMNNCCVDSRASSTASATKTVETTFYWVSQDGTKGSSNNILGKADGNTKICGVEGYNFEIEIDKLNKDTFEKIKKDYNALKGSKTCCTMDERGKIKNSDDDTVVSDSSTIWINDLFSTYIEDTSGYTDYRDYYYDLEGSNCRVTFSGFTFTLGYPELTFNCPAQYLEGYSYSNCNYLNNGHIPSDIDSSIPNLNNYGSDPRLLTTEDEYYKYNTRVQDYSPEKPSSNWFIDASDVGKYSE